MHFAYSSTSKAFQIPNSFQSIEMVYVTISTTKYQSLEFYISILSEVFQWMYHQFSTKFPSLYEAMAPHLKCLETRRISVGSRTVPTVQKNHYCPRKMIPKWDAKRKWWVVMDRIEPEYRKISEDLVWLEVSLTMRITEMKNLFTFTLRRKIYNKTSLAAWRIGEKLLKTLEKFSCERVLLMRCGFEFHSIIDQSVKWIK